ncbi:MAG TPA: SPFH domain-containing protein [Chloroflexota bacterium]|nr:SPFH domain-containing protein [Chloroflexota bacterium]
MNPFGILGIAVVAAVVFVILLISALAARYVKVGPNQALIVYGRTKLPRVIVGGGTFVFPVIERAQVFSLELMSFDVAPQQNLYTNQGVSVRVEAVTQLKVRNDHDSILTAAEQFLSKPPQQREAMIRLVMEGHLRGIVGLLTVEHMVKEPEMVAGRVRETVADDLSKMGLEVVSFTIKRVTDEKDYINNMGRPDVARIKREADIAQAEAERDTAIKRAQASREAAIAQAEADQQRVIAQTASQTKQAEATRDLEVAKAEYEAAMRRQKAIAEKAYDIAANEALQKVVAEQVKVEQVQKLEQIRVQELEVQRRERELESTLVKQADAERQRIELLADAERLRLERQATGQAEAIRLQGNAEAEIVRAKGQAEADAMHLRAAAIQQYNQAAVLDKMLTGLPLIAAEFAKALAGVDKITVVSTGSDGRANGASQLTGEMAKMVAQVPELLETITGKSLGDLLTSLRSIEAPAAQAPLIHAATAPAATALAVTPSGAQAPVTANGTTGEGHELKA